MTDRERAQELFDDMVNEGALLSKDTYWLQEFESLLHDARTAALQEAAQRVEKVLEKQNVLNAAHRKEITDAIWGRVK